MLYPTAKALFTKKFNKTIYSPLISLQTCRTFFILQNIKYSDIMKNSGNKRFVVMEKKLHIDISPNIFFYVPQKKLWNNIGGVNDERIDIFWVNSLTWLAVPHYVWVSSETHSLSFHSHTADFPDEWNGRGSHQTGLRHRTNKTQICSPPWPWIPLHTALGPLIFMCKVCQTDREQDLRSWNAFPCSWWYARAQGQAISATQTKTFNS